MEVLVSTDTDPVLDWVEGRGILGATRSHVLQSHDFTHTVVPKGVRQMGHSLRLLELNQL